MQRKFKVNGVAVFCVLVLTTAVGCGEPPVNNSQEKGADAGKRFGKVHEMQRDPKAALPSAHSADEAGKPLLSWRVYLLPQLEQENLFDQFKLDEPWDSPHNRKLVSQMPAIYRSEYDLPEGKTASVALVSKDSAMPHGHSIRFADITDGLSNTILFVDANPECAVTWTKPDDIEFDPQNPFKCLGKGGSFRAVFCDGSAHTIPVTIGAETMRRLVNRHDGKTVSLDF